VKIICRTGPAPAGEMDAPVIIGNAAGYTESTVKYSYKVSNYHVTAAVRMEKKKIERTNAYLISVYLEFVKISAHPF